MKPSHYFAVALLALGMSHTAQAAVTATLNKNNFTSGETIQLRLQRDGSADGQPDIAPLRKDFDLLGSSTGSNVQIINGKISTQTQVTLLLAPKREGKIQIPALQWGGEHTTAIEITVGANGGAAQQGATQADKDAAHFFISTSLDQKQPYVQAAVVLTVRLYFDQQLLQASLDFPPSTDVLLKQLGKDVPSSETRYGRNYQIIERKYLLFPQRSGKLSLKGPVLDAQVLDSSNDPVDSFFRRMPFGGMANTTRPIRIHAKPIELNVQPRPANVSGQHWLPAQKVTLVEKNAAWSQGKTTVRVGEPLTRRIRLEALGLTGAQLPDPHALMTVPEGIKAYPDQAVISDTQQGNTVVGSREQNIALIASHPGLYELPAIKLSWWDSLQNETREVNLPAHTLEVVAAAVGTNPAAIPLTGTEPVVLSNPSTQANPLDPAYKLASKQPWMWISLVLAVLWLATLVAWWRSSKRDIRKQPLKVPAEAPAPTIRGGAEFKALRRACSNNDPYAARQHLLAWSSTTWPDAQPRGLNELALKFSDEKLIEALKQLDRACYTDSTWQGEALSKSLPQSPIVNIIEKKKNTLPALYE